LRRISRRARLRDRLRLRGAIERAEAIVAPDGEVRHATGAAKAPESSTHCGMDASDRKGSRQAARRSARRALGIWKGLVVARWTLVDHFESDGRRYVLAQENEPDDSSRAALSPASTKFWRTRALGRSNKEIRVCARDWSLDGPRSAYAGGQEARLEQSSRARSPIRGAENAPTIPGGLAPRKRGGG